MSREFLRASSEGLFADVSEIDAPLFTISCWFYALDITAAGTLVSIVDKGVGTRRIALWVRGDNSGDPLQLLVSYSGSSQPATTTGYSADTWHHGCAVSRSATDKSVFLDGGGEGTDATSTASSMPGLDRTAVGYLSDSSPSQYMDGRVAEVGIWDVALIDAEVAMLAAGAAPLMVRPESLVTYLPLIRDDDTDIMGVTGAYTELVTPTIATHPPGIIYPDQQEVWVPSAAAAPGVSHEYLAAHAARVSSNRRLRM